MVDRRRNGERVVGTWKEIKTTMRKRFVPKYYLGICLIDCRLLLWVSRVLRNIIRN